jgi:hypothetical protein
MCFHDVKEGELRVSLFHLTMTLKDVPIFREKKRFLLVGHFASLSFRRSVSFGYWLIGWLVGQLIGRSVIW